MFRCWWSHSEGWVILCSVLNCSDFRILYVSHLTFFFLSHNFLLSYWLMLEMGTNFDVFSGLLCEFNFHSLCNQASSEHILQVPPSRSLFRTASVFCHELFNRCHSGWIMRQNTCVLANVTRTLIIFIQHISLALCFTPTSHYNQRMPFKLRIAKECYWNQCSLLYEWMENGEYGLLHIAVVVGM